MSTGPTDHVGEAVERLAEMHRQHRERSTPAQRFANKVTRALGRPAAILAAVGIVVAWVLGNLSATRFHFQALEPAPFPTWRWCWASRLSSLRC